MVHNPKHSQKIMMWCLESVLGLAFRAAENIHEKLTQKKLREYIDENTADVSNKQVSQMFYDLRRHDYLEVGEGDSVKLTNKAKIKIIDQISKSKSRDGKHRFVSFDIPETKRAGRNNFRRAIKKIGFKQVQKSLWISDRNVGDLVDAAAKEYGVSEFIAYFVAEASNIDKHLTSVLNAGTTGEDKPHDNKA